MIKDQQNFYWLFSSSAQVVAVFVAFLLTGYAIVLNVMDGIQAKDDTLEEIHHKFKTNYYRWIILISIITGLAIGFNLWMVYLNGIDWCNKNWLYLISVILDGLVVILGIAFVITIINPGRYKKIAREILKDDKKEFPPSSAQDTTAAFMNEFIKLERTIRDVLARRELYRAYGNTPQMAFSVRQMVLALYQNELIDQNTLNELNRINKYRNLVVHGHQTQVDRNMIDAISRVREKISQIH
jgi:hypothetical protein